MTLVEIAALLGAVDPGIRFGWSMAKGEDYTYWEPTRRLPMVADDHHAEEGWAFYVHRFTRRADDPIAPALFAALDGQPNVTVGWTQAPERETGYIHHIFTCEAV